MHNSQRVSVLEGGASLYNTSFGGRSSPDTDHFLIMVEDETRRSSGKLPGTFLEFHPVQPIIRSARDGVVTWPGK